MKLIMLWLVGPKIEYPQSHLGEVSSPILVSHNHPSGDPAPSAADIPVTRQLREASKIIDIELLDHVIAGHAESDPLSKGYYSFREAGIV